MTVDRLLRWQAIRRLAVLAVFLVAAGGLIQAADAQNLMRGTYSRAHSGPPMFAPRFAPRMRQGFAPGRGVRMGRRFAPEFVPGMGPGFGGVRDAPYRGPRMVPGITPRRAAHGFEPVAPRAGRNVRAGRAARAAAHRNASRRDRTSIRDTARHVPPHRPPPSHRPHGERHVPPRVAVVLPTIPFVRYAPNTYPSCRYTGRDDSGRCSDRPAYVADLGGSGRGGPPPVSQNGGARVAAAGFDRRYVPGQVVAELDGALSDAQVRALARRHWLTLLGMQDIPLIGGRLGLFRIDGGRSVQSVQRRLALDDGVRLAQPNFRYVLQDQTSIPAQEGDPAQYAVRKLRLPQAHALSHGGNVTVAVIDSGIDAHHPELADAVVGTFDALGSKEGPHVHGTGIAGAIVAHGRLIGSAPSARILAIRAFGVTRGGAESTSFVILKSLDYAAGHGAQIINMSFAGPKDALVGRGVAAAEAKGIVLVAASGNAGPKSPPLYPAADSGVIAVSATDAYDRLFPASNRGRHVAVAAPGVDVFLPAPGGKYQLTTGTSFSAAYVSGLAALMIARDPKLKADQVRAILMKTARDLGDPGRDDLFGAGEADAFGAVSAVTAPIPVASSRGEGGTGTTDARDRAAVPASPSATTLAGDKAAGK